LDELANMS